MAASIRVMQKQIILLEAKVAHLQTDPTAICFSKKSHVSVVDSEEIVTSDVNVAIPHVNELGDDEEDAEAEYTAHDSEMTKTSDVKAAVRHVNEFGGDDERLEGSIVLKLRPWMPRLSTRSPTQWRTRPRCITFGTTASRWNKETQLEPWTQKAMKSSFCCPCLGKSTMLVLPQKFSQMSCRR
eukprot:TRINITY_DN14443_c0_g3_i1.p1 TRINITY_DN14443_c0_g3~~TRINITY_DN14443_c0_g3_i1.p1  ORF type:complete len:204 (-),score=28.57 TRINITY_DN14443_c0_g3_i1:221-769(-)